MIITPAKIQKSFPHDYVLRKLGFERVTRAVFCYAHLSTRLRSTETNKHRYTYAKIEDTFHTITFYGNPGPQCNRQLEPHSFHTITFYGNTFIKRLLSFYGSTAFHTITFYGNMRKVFVNLTSHRSFHTITFYGNKKLTGIEYKLVDVFPHDYVLRKRIY